MDGSEAKLPVGVTSPSPTIGDVDVQVRHFAKGSDDGPVFRSRMRSSLVRILSQVFGIVSLLTTLGTFRPPFRRAAIPDITEMR